MTYELLLTKRNTSSTHSVSLYVMLRICMYKPPQPPSGQQKKRGLMTDLPLCFVRGVCKGNNQLV